MLLGYFVSVGEEATDMFGHRLSQERYLNPLTDFGFKDLFGTEPNKALLLILDVVFDEHKNDDTILHRVELKDQQCEVFYEKHFYEKLKCIYLELPKFKMTIEVLETHFDKWLFLLRHLPKLGEPPAERQESAFSQLFEAAEIAKVHRAVGVDLMDCDYSCARALIRK